MKKTFDPTKPVQTVDGRKARIICTDRKGLWPIIALVPSHFDASCEAADYFNKKGESCGNSRNNLVNIPTVRHEYMNVVPGNLMSNRWSSEAEADDALATGAFHRLRILGVPKGKATRLKLTYEDEVLVRAEVVPILS